MTEFDRQLRGAAREAARTANRLRGGGYGEDLCMTTLKHLDEIHSAACSITNNINLMQSKLLDLGESMTPSNETAIGCAMLGHWASTMSKNMIDFIAVIDIIAKYATDTRAASTR